MSGYIDLYLLPVPRKNLAAYRKQANRFGKMAREYGALDYREFMGDDLSHKGTRSFKQAVTVGRGEVVTAAVVGFKSRTHRDQVMKKMFKDPRMKEMMSEKPLTDMKKMFYGGFETFVEA